LPRSNTYDFRSPASTDIFSDKRNYNTALSSGPIDRISDSLSRGSQVVEDYFKENKEHYKAMGVGAVGGTAYKANEFLDHGE
jgi:hypothetical protein